MRQLSVILVLSFFLTGCSLINSYQDSYKFKYMHSTATTNFTNLTEDLVDKLARNLYNVKHNNMQYNTPLYVTDFVNLKDLNNHSELGFMLSEEVKSHVAQKFGIHVNAIEYTKYLKIGSKGTKLLSRDVKELKNKRINSNTFALIGTYALTQRQLIMYLKLVNLHTGVIIDSATESATLTDEIIHYELDPNRKEIVNIYQPMTL